MNILLKNRSYIFAAVLFAVVGLYFGLKNFLPPFSLPFYWGNPSPVVVDGIPFDWNKTDLRFVDGDREAYARKADPHVMAFSFKESAENAYFAVYYPSFANYKNKVFIALDFNTGGTKEMVKNLLYTASPNRAVLKITDQGAYALSDKNTLIPGLKIEKNNFYGFMEMSLPAKELYKYGYRRGREFNISVGVTDESEKNVLDTLPNKVTPLLTSPTRGEVEEGAIPSLASASPFEKGGERGILGKQSNPPAPFSKGGFTGEKFKSLAKKIVPPALAISEPFTSKAFAATVKFAIVNHGNQSVSTYDQPSGDILVENGGRNGFIRILQAHFDTGIPINIHLSGSLMTGMKWNYDVEDTNPAHKMGGLTFLAKMKTGVDSKLVGLVTSTYAQNIMPFMYKDENKFAIDIENELFIHHFGKSPVIAWVPERTWVNDPNIQWHSNDPYTGANNNVKDKTMAETFASQGVKALLLDGNQHHNWFHNPDPKGYNDNGMPHKINNAGTSTFSGAVAFFNNRDLQDKVCSGDGGWGGIQQTMNWVATLGDGAIGVYGDDWEKSSGYSSTWPDDLTDGYVRTIWLLKGQAYIETVNLETFFLDWFKYKYDNAGTDDYPTIEIPYGTYENPVMFMNGGDYYQKWDQHSDVKAKNKTDWRTFRQVLVDAYNAILDAELETGQDYKTNNLIKVARAVMAATSYEWMWHDSNDVISGWQVKMDAHIKNAMYYAEGAKWAFDPVNYGAKAQLKDVDNDKTQEIILQNDKIMGIFEPDGGRLVAMFYRDSTGQGEVVIGNDVRTWYGAGGDWPNWESDWVDADHMGALMWHEAECNDGYFQDTHTPNNNLYGNTIANTVYTTVLGAESVTFNSGATAKKTITLGATGDKNYFDVSINGNTSAEYTAYPNKKRCVIQFNPGYIDIFKNGKAAVTDFGADVVGQYNNPSYYGVVNTKTTSKISGYVDISGTPGATVEKTYKVLMRELVIKSADGASPLTFKLYAGPLPGGGVTNGTISGSVKDEITSSAIAGANVELIGTALSTLTDGTGNYSFANVPPNTYTIRASKSGYNTRSQTGVVVNSGQNTVSNVLLNQLTPPPPLGSVAGQVVKSGNSQPVQQVKVELYVGTNTLTSITDGNGNYIISGISTGTYNMKAFKVNYTTGTTNNVAILANSTTTVNFSLLFIDTGTPVALGNISGVVKNAVTGETINGAGVRITGTQNLTNTNASGQFNFMDLSTGTYALTATMTGFTTGAAVNVTVYASSTTTVNFNLNVSYIPGDINHDEIVDGKDLLIFSTAYGAQKGGQYYNSEANIDNNGASTDRIDDSDLAVLRTNYGKKGRQ